MIYLKKCQFFLTIHRRLIRNKLPKSRKMCQKTAFYVDVSVFCTNFLVFLNANISKTKQQRYGFLFIFRCIASKYMCIQKKNHSKGQLDFKIALIKLKSDKGRLH